MNFQNLMNWKNGNFEDYEKCLNNIDKVKKKLAKLNNDLDFKIDALGLLMEDEENNKERIEKVTKERFEIIKKIEKTNEKYKKLRNELVTYITSKKENE